MGNYPGGSFALEALGSSTTTVVTQSGTTETTVAESKLVPALQISTSLLVKFKLWGWVDVLATGKVLTIKLKYDGSTIATGTYTASGAATDTAFSIEGTFQIITDSATGAIAANAKAFVQDNVTLFGTDQAGTTSIDTTGDAKFSITLDTDDATADIEVHGSEWEFLTLV